MVKVHYFYDPMCGWCYGATPLVEVLATHPDIELTMHAGGMIERRAMSESFKAMAQEHDAKIAAMTGQVFSEAYNARLRNESEITLDSYVTAHAITNTQQRYGQGIAMLKAVQQAHFYLGLDVSQPQVLAQVAQQLVQESDESSLFDASVDIKQHIAQSHGLMNQWQVQGFPTFIIEYRGKLQRLAHTRYYNDASAWQAHLDQVINQLKEQAIDA